MKDNDNAIKTVTEAINKVNNNWIPNWHDKYENKYYISRLLARYWVEKYQLTQLPLSLPYCKSRAALEIIIDNHIEDLDLIFGEGQ